jgi:hypothetical protein
MSTNFYERVTNRLWSGLEKRGAVLDAVYSRKPEGVDIPVHVVLESSGGQIGFESTFELGSNDVCFVIRNNELTYNDKRFAPKSGDTITIESGDGVDVYTVITDVLSVARKQSYNELTHGARGLVRILTERTSTELE